MPTLPSANGGSYLLNEQFNYRISQNWPATGVITTGLSLYLDAFIPQSYPGTGSTWFDLSGNNRNATINGAISFTSGYFNTSSDSTYMSLSNVGLVPRLDDFTYSCWVYFNAFNTYNTIFENGTWTDSLIFRQESSTSLVVYAEGASRGTFSWTGATGTWYNIVFVRASNTFSCYINNVLRGTPFTVSVDINLANQSFFIMRSTHTTSQFINGRISVFKIYNRALSVSEISENYNNLKNRYGL